jgi:hypothetical protein
MGDVTMNDDFLKNYKKQPRPEFARSLRLKLLQKGDSRMKPIKPIFRYVFAALLIGLMSVAAVPSVRAQVEKIFQPVVHFMYTTEPAPTSTTPDLAAPFSGEEAIEDTMDLASAQAQLGFKTLLPKWLPEGFVLSQNKASIMRAPDKVIGLHVYWESDIARIDLYATPEEGESTLSEVKGSKKVEVNGQTAVLVHVGGKENEDTEHAALIIPMDGYMLEFTQDGVSYIITVSAASKDDLISEEDLIKVAESLQ